MNLELASHNRSDWPVEAWEAAELLDSGTTLRGEGAIALRSPVRPSSASSSSGARTGQFCGVGTAGHPAFGCTVLQADQPNTPSCWARAMSSVNTHSSTHRPSLYRSIATKPISTVRPVGGMPARSPF